MNRRSYQGEGNPHFGIPHTAETKEMISQTQKLRNDYLRKIAEGLREERIDQIIDEVIQRFKQKQKEERRKRNVKEEQ